VCPTLARRRQFLWIHPRGADCYFLAPGNIAAAAGSKGTLLIWQWPFWRHDAQDSFWQLKVSDTNYMDCYLGRSFRVCSGGVVKKIDGERYTSSFAWDLMVHTWDFTTPNAGQLRLYWNGASIGTPINNANAPVGTPPKLTLGPVLNQETKGPHLIYALAVWNDVMTPAQVAAIWAEGPRGTLAESAGTGALTLLANFNQQYNADHAHGSPTFATTGASDHYCLLNDGALEWRRRRFLVGTPRHDFSEDDRVPICVPCPTEIDFARISWVADNDYASYGEIVVTAGSGTTRALGSIPAGRPVFDATFMNKASTYRQRLHIPQNDNPTGKYIRLGPVDYLHYPTKANDVYDQWGSGRRFLVVADAGNSPTQFKTDLGALYTNDYWNGAYVVFITGNCKGRRLLVTDYDGTTKVITLESALPATPTAASVGIVDPRARLQGLFSKEGGSYGNRLPEFNMDALLWEFHAGYQYFTELEFQFVDFNTDEALTPNCLRYERGRTALLDGLSTPGDNWGFYGRKSNDPDVSCKILIERIELDGPGTYMLLRRDNSGVGPDYADNLMVRAADGHSTKAWRVKNLTWTKVAPTKITDYSAVKADLQASGTWRHAVNLCPIPVSYNAEEQKVTAALVGSDSGGTLRVGYIVGQWNAVTGRIAWVDETPPGGKSNPFLLHSDLRPAKNADTPCVGADLINILQASDGTWSLTYNSKTSEPDHLMTFLLYGAEDRWSFSRALHFWEGNPVAPIMGGPDLVNPDGDGYGTWASRDAGWYILENPYTHDPARRYIGHARGKTILHRHTNYAVDLRPVIGVRGADLRAMTPLPHGNVVSPLPAPLIHLHDSAILGQGDCIGLYSDTATGAMSSGVYHYISEDGVHFQTFAVDTAWLPQGQLVGEPTRLYPGRPFRLGDRRIYYYNNYGSFLNCAWLRLDGECWYALTTGQTQGLLETPMIQKPTPGWWRLLLNAAPGNGTLTVEVLDPDTAAPLTGFSAAEFAGISDSVEQEALWNGVGLDAVTADTIRLRFNLSAASGTSPKLYSWKIEDVPAPPAPNMGGGIFRSGLIQ